MLTVDYTQFSLPNGHQTFHQLEIEDPSGVLKVNYLALLECGCHLTLEQLTTGAYSFCVEEPNLGDFDCQLEKDPVSGFAKLLARFRAKEAALWQKNMS